MNPLLLAAAVAQTFNLSCTGTRTTTDISGTRTEPYSDEYRVDLGKAQWCEAECKGLFPIANIQQTSIELQHKEVDSDSETSLLSNIVDRETGRQHILATFKNPHSRLETMILDWAGQCEAKPFTGFPAFETKF